jgi:hypothetical protein
LPWIRIECRDEPVELIPRWSPVSFVALSDKAESCERDASEVYVLRRNNDPVNGRGVAQDRLDVSEINSQGNGTGALSCAFLSELNETFAIEFRKSQSSKPTFEEGETRGFGAPDALADLLEVSAMKPDEIPECPRFPAGDRRLAPIDAPLGFERPFLRVPAAKKCIVDILPLPSDLDAPRSRFEPSEGRHGVCAPCALRRRTGAKIVAPWRRKACTRGDLTI